MARERPEEEGARRIVEQTLGFPVRLHDDGSRDRMHDFTIDFGQAVGALEVTAALDPQMAAQWSAIDGDGERWIVPDIAGGWSLRLTPSARVRKIKADGPALLRDLEAMEVRNLRDLHSRAPLRLRAKSLGIRDAYRSGTDFPGSVYLMPDPANASGFVQENGNHLVSWIGSFLATERPDVVDKLAASGADEKHAFVWVPLLTDAPWEVFDVLVRSDEPAVPIVAPALPPGVSHVWIASTLRVGYGLRWEPTRWSVFRTSQPANPARERS